MFAASADATAAAGTVEQQTAAANPAGCTLTAFDPNLIGGSIDGSASQICDVAVSQYINGSLQQYRGLGYWSTKDRDNPSAFDTATFADMSWPCAGSGSQLYRTRASAGYELGGLLYQSGATSLQIRLIC